MYNPPVVQRHDIPVPESAGLSSVFQVSLAVTPTRVLVDTGDSVSFIDANFAKRVGLHVAPFSSSSAPDIQLADGASFSCTGHVSAPMRLHQHKSTLHALAADLSRLPTDILLGDAWMRDHHGSIGLNSDGAAYLSIQKGKKHISLQPLHAQPGHLPTIQLNAMQMSAN